MHQLISVSSNLLIRTDHLCRTAEIAWRRTVADAESRQPTLSFPSLPCCRRVVQEKNLWYPHSINVFGSQVSIDAPRTDPTEMLSQIPLVDGSDHMTFRKGRYPTYSNGRAYGVLDGACAVSVHPTSDINSRHKCPSLAACPLHQRTNIRHLTWSPSMFKDQKSTKRF